MLKPSILSWGGSFTQGYRSHTSSNLMNFMNAPQSAGVCVLIKAHKQPRVTHTTVNWVAVFYFFSPTFNWVEKAVMANVSRDSFNFIFAGHSCFFSNLKVRHL